MEDAGPIRPLAWEPPYATAAALKSKKEKTKKTPDLTPLLKRPKKEPAP